MAPIDVRSVPEVSSYAVWAFEVMPRDSFHADKSGKGKFSGD